MKIESKLVFRLGVILGILTMVAGSAGAHGIKFESDYLKSLYETGTFYMFFHIPVILIMGIVGIVKPAFLMTAGTILFCVPLWTKGIGLFSGGIIVPVGGMMMIAAWIWMLFAGNDMKKEDTA